MVNRSAAAAAVVAVMAVVTPAAAQTPAALSCEVLAKLVLPHVTIASAEPVAAGQFAPPAPPQGAGRGGRGGANPFAGVPAFCRVAAASTPAPDSDIRFEVWLPLSGWNGKLQTVGNGGYAGTIGYAAMGTAVSAGYAAASTDTGHQGGDPAFLMASADKLTDFAYRAVHETTVAAKVVIARYYGSAPKLSYFNGCSTGGRQALTAAQRYPADFDGIVAGAPANYTAHMTAMQLYSGNVVQRDPAAALPQAARDALHAAALAACDADEGVKDGIIENPLDCRIDARKVTALKPAQAVAANRIYDGLGRAFPGLAPGSELGWNTLSGGEPFGYALGFWRYVVFKDPTWDPKTLTLETDLPKADSIASRTGLQAINPDLNPFFERGGKLVMYHGWNDPAISPYNSVNYYKSVRDSTSGANSIRLFMMPGVNHCQGGVGTDTWDKVKVLDQWRETGRAPSQVVASHATDGKVDRTRPLCAFPQVAVYRGAGSTNDAANFDCRVP